MDVPTFQLDLSGPPALLRHCPAYRPSPLRAFDLHKRKLWIKNETDRMGLGHTGTFGRA